MTRSRYAIVLLALLALTAHLLAVDRAGGLDRSVVAIDLALAAIVVALALAHVQRLARERRSAALRDTIAGVIREPRGIAGTAGKALESLAALGIGERGLIALADQDGGSLSVVAASGYPEGWVASSGPIASSALRGPLPVVGRGSAEHPWIEPLCANGADRPPWVATVGLTSGGDAIGIMLLGGRDRRPLRDPDLLAETGELVATALHWAALYEASYEREQDLEEQEGRRREFLAAIAHEIRTPLTSIQAFSDLLLDQGGANGRGGRELLDSLRRGVDRLTGLVNDLIDLGRVQRLEAEPRPSRVQICELLRAAEMLLRPSFMLREQALRLDLPDQPIHAVADRTHVEQVVLNLLSNANRHTPERGSILVRARECDGHVRIEVQDSGPGIDRADRERVFEPYYRVRRSDGRAVPGSGLGLAVARRLTELQGGRVWIEDAEPRGSRFCVELRAAGAPDSLGIEATTT